MVSDETLTRAEALAPYGTSQCREYRRAWQRECRRNQRRIDYMPTKKACAVIDAAIRSGVALSQADAIEHALAEWRTD